MRDPLKEPRYGDVFVWVGTTTRSRVLVMFLAPTGRGNYWRGLALADGHVSGNWLPLIGPWEGRWSVVP